MINTYADKIFLKKLKDDLMALTSLELKAFENIAFEIRYAKEQEMRKAIEAL